MGGLSEIVVADRSEAQAITTSGGPTRDWQGNAWKKGDTILLGSLWAILENEVVQVDNVVDRSGRFTLLSQESENGPWVFLIPDSLRDLLADLSSADPEAFQQIAETWGATDELEAWESS